MLIWSRYHCERTSNNLNTRFLTHSTPPSQALGLNLCRMAFIFLFFFIAQQSSTEFKVAITLLWMKLFCKGAGSELLRSEKLITLLKVEKNVGARDTGSSSKPLRAHLALRLLKRAWSSHLEPRVFSNDPTEAPAGRRAREQAAGPEPRETSFWRRASFLLLNSSSDTEGCKRF